MLNELKTLLSENARILSEKWSVCDKAEEYCDAILEEIRNNLPNSNTERVDKGILFHEGVLKNFKIMEQTIQIHYYVYHCFIKNVADFLYEEGRAVNGYNEDDKILFLTSYMVNNQWVNEYCEKIVVHGTEHIIQINYGYSNNFKYKGFINSAYKQARDVLADGAGHSRIDMIVAKLIYYSNAHEQDAFMQEYAKELKHKLPFSKEKTETEKLLGTYEEYVEYILNNVKSPSVINAVKAYRPFGYTMSNFKLMCTKQLQRFKRKMKNVEKNFKGRTLI